MSEEADLVRAIERATAAEKWELAAKLTRTLNARRAATRFEPDGPDKRFGLGPGVYFAIDGQLVDRGYVEGQDARERAHRMLLGELEPWAELGVRVDDAHRGAIGPRLAREAQRIRVVNHTDQHRIALFDGGQYSASDYVDLDGITYGPFFPTPGHSIVRFAWASFSTPMTPRVRIAAELHVEEGRTRTQWVANHARLDLFFESVADAIAKSHAGCKVAKLQVPELHNRGVASEEWRCEDHRVRIARWFEVPIPTLPLPVNRPLTLRLDYERPAGHVQFWLLVWEDV